MLRWILKTLWLQKITLFSSAGGVAAALLLVLLMDAVFTGESKQIIAYIRHTNPDVWVMQRGVSNMHMASSFVWDWKTDRIAKLPGVRQATPILYLNTMINTAGSNWFAFVVGFPGNAARGGPWKMASGRPWPQTGEIILPEVLAEVAGIELGAKASIADQTFTVVGLSEETFSMANAVAFVAFADLEDLLSATGTVSYILVDALPVQDPKALAALIEQEVEKVSALPQQEFMQSDFEMAMMMGVEIIAFMSLIGTVLATLVIAFTAYSQVSQLRRELAVVKALGTRNTSIYLAVVVHTLLITGLGLIFALLTVFTLFPLISALVPQVTLSVTASALLQITAIALSVALLAALAPAYIVAQTDPVTAFRT